MARAATAVSQQSTPAVSSDAVLSMSLPRSMLSPGQPENKTQWSSEVCFSHSKTNDIQHVLWHLNSHEHLLSA